MAWRHLTLAIAALAAPFLVGADAPYYTDLDSYQNSFLGERPRQHFHSSKVVAPVYQINHWDAAKMNATESPYLFMAGNYDGWGASIVSAKDLSLVWADQCCNGLAQAARSWTYKGKNVLVVYVDGRVRIYDESYHVTHILEPQGSLSGLVPDSHEASMTFDDNVLMVVCPAVKVNLTSVGGPEEGRVLDCNVQEFDPDTKEVKFQFSTLSYFGVEDSVMEYKGEDVWDFCHMNSVEKTRDGNFIISYRHLSCVIMVDGRTNEVLWVMWGKKNMFTDVTDPSLGTGSAEFHFQHEPRFTGTNRFTLFDNHRTSNGFCGEGMDPCSRGLEVEFDPQAKTVWMVDEWFHPQRIKSGSRGGVQRTADNNTLVAWGQNPLLTEYTPEGDIAMDVQRGQVLEIEHGVFDVLQYRVWKGPWEGSPRWPPSIGCFRDSSEHPSLFVSWNGATKVETYVLLSAPEKGQLNGPDKIVAQSPRNGFETKFAMDDVDLKRYARIAALDAQGAILGSTPAIDTHNCNKVDLDYNVTEVFGVDATVITGVPSSAGIIMPLGTGATRWGYFNSTEDEDEADGEEDQVMGLSMSTILGAGAVAGAVIVITGAIVSLVYCIRRRGAARAPISEPYETNTASYGLLQSDEMDNDADEGTRYADKDKDEVEKNDPAAQRG